MFTQGNIGCHKTKFCDGLALNKSEQNSKKCLTKQSFCDNSNPSKAIKKLRFVKALSNKNEVFVQQSRLPVTKTELLKKTNNKNEVFVQFFFKYLRSGKQEILSDDDTKRFAFYYAGKCLVQTLLLHHPKTFLFKITEPKNHTVSSNQTLSLQNKVLHNSTSEKPLSIKTRINLETLLIGFYAGKVGEFFYSYTTQNTTHLKKRLFFTTVHHNTSFGVLENNNPKQSVASSLPFHAKIDQFLYQSDIGFSERVRATRLLKHILVNGSIYSPNFLSLKRNSILGNLNKTEILERKVFALFQSLEEEMNTVYGKQHRHNKKNDKSKLIRNGSSTSKIDSISQNRETSAWCEEMVCKALTFYRKPYGHWFRIYLPQIETHQRQPASLDKFFTKSRELKVLSETTNTSYSNRLQGFACNSTNTVTQIRHPWSQEESHGTSHNLVLNSFSRAFHLIGKNRELLDILADHLIRFGKIRMPEILRISEFYVDTGNLREQSYVFSEEIEKTKQ